MEIMSKQKGKKKNVWEKIPKEFRYFDIYTFSSEEKMGKMT